MAPLWLRIIYTLVGLVVFGGIAVTNLVWPSKVQAFATRMSKGMPPHPLFGSRTPDMATVIVCGIGCAISTIILIYVLIKLILQAWGSN
jgi:hypothetical protein